MDITADATRAIQPHPGPTPQPTAHDGAVAAPGRRYSGPTYYGLPAVKPSSYGPLVWAYTYIAGLSGAAQILASIADLDGRRSRAGMVRNGRYIALAGAATGAALLIADLHTPQRWYNMLRIFRPTSPMSIGSAILSGFGAFSGLTALAQYFSRPGRRWTRRLARVSEVPAALTGAGMTFYTGALLSATSTPLWAAGPHLLPARFACSAMATAAAALSLAESPDGGAAGNARALDRLAALATVAESALSAAAHRNEARQGLTSPSGMDSLTATEDAFSRHLGQTLPLVCYCLGALMPARRQSLSRMAALGVLAGGLLMRASVFRAGNNSARDPREYLALTRADRADGGD